MNESDVPHVTLAGDYVITEERPDGTLVLAPEAAWATSLRRRGLRPVTNAEFDAFAAEHGPLLSADDEG